ncbi:MAG: YgjV family protein [Ruminococcaceae bacterium]|nr:YgjV family protein [Oscillospiraceae bacterium]
MEERKMEILVRIFGIIGLILCIIPFQFKKHKHIVLCKMVSEISFAVQYFLLGGFMGVAGAFTGAWIDLVSGLRNFLFYKFVEKKWSTTPVIIVFSVVVIVLGVTSWSGWLSLLPILAKLLTTVSYGMKNERLLRLITLPSCILWVAYNCYIGTWEAAIADCLALISILIAMYKFDYKKKAPSETEEA